MTKERIAAIAGVTEKLEMDLSDARDVMNTKIDVACKEIHVLQGMAIGGREITREDIEPMYQAIRALRDVDIEDFIQNTNVSDMYSEIGRANKELAASE